VPFAEAAQCGVFLSGKASVCLGGTLKDTEVAAIILRQFEVQ
jgi:hypothetical protein